MKKTHYPAKICRPEISEVLFRDKLFVKLEALRTQQTIWIAAPGGSGKTTLANTYIKSKKVPCLWYHVDGNDNDPGTFFHYLGLAGKKTAPRRRNINWLLRSLVDTFSLNCSIYFLQKVSLFLITVKRWARKAVFILSCLLHWPGFHKVQIYYAWVGILHLLPFQGSKPIENSQAWAGMTCASLLMSFQQFWTHKIFRFPRSK